MKKKQIPPSEQSQKDSTVLSAVNAPVMWLQLWTSGDWWKYLLMSPNGCSKWTAFWCRQKGHPCGVMWYNVGYEPDMHCKNCGDDLG